MDDVKFSILVQQFMQELDYIWEEYKTALAKDREEILNRYIEEKFDYDFQEYGIPE
jgi:hypothetical protein